MTVQFGLADLGGNTLASAKSLDPLVSGSFKISDVVGTSDPVDYYRFTLTAAQAIDLSLSGLSTAAQMTLYRSDGQAIYIGAGAPDGPSRLSGALAAGTYYVGVSSSVGLDTAYTLALTSPAGSDGPAGHGLATATSLGTLSSTEKLVSDRVDSAFGADAYSFTLTSAQTVNFRLSGLAANAQASIAIVDAVGNLVYSGNAYAYADALLSKSLGAGTYYALVTTPAGGASSYTLGAWTGAIAVGSSGTDIAGATNSAAKALGTLTATGTTVSDYVGLNGDVDVYKVTLGALSQLNLRLMGLSADSAYSVTMTVTNADGDIFYSASPTYYQGNDTFGFSGVQSLAAGDYYVTISSQTPTGYQLKASATALPDGASRDASKPTSLGTLSATPVVKSDWVGTAARDDFYTFTLTSEQLVSLRLTAPSGGGGTASVSLIDADGNPIAWGTFSEYVSVNVPGSVRQDGVIERVLAAGTYKVQIHSDYDNRAYSLSASATASPNGTAGKTIATATALGTLGATPVAKTDWTGRAAREDFYSFTVGAYSLVTLRVNTLSGNGLPYLDIETADGAIIASSTYGYSTADEGILLTNLGAGTYYVHVANPQGNPADDGAYTLKASAVVASTGAGGASRALATALPGGVTATTQQLTDVVGGTAGGDDWYKFTLASAQTVNFSGLVPQGATGSISLALYDANGTSIASGSFTEAGGTGLSAANLAAGTYYLDVMAPWWLGKPTPYSLTYSSTTPATGTPAATDAAGNDFATARNLGTLSKTAVTAADWVGTSGTKIDGSDYYQFTLTDSSRIAISFIAKSTDSNIYTLYYEIRSVDGTFVTNGGLSTDGSIDTAGLDLAAGNYFLRVYPADPSYSIGYSLSAAVSTVYSHAVGNDLASAADLGAIGTSAVSVSGTGDPFRGDMYRFALGSDSDVSITLSLPGGSPTSATAGFTIYDALGHAIEGGGGVSAANPVSKVHLAAGIYYVRFGGSAGIAYQATVVGSAAASKPVVAAGSTLATADALGKLTTTAVTQAGWVGSGLTTHYYGFTIDKASRISLQLALTDGDSSSVAVVFYDAQGNAISDGSVLGAGSYFVAISGPTDVGRHASYSLSLAATAADGTAGRDYATATAITPTATAATVSDWLGADRSTDVYRFSLSSQQVLNLQFSAAGSSAGFGYVYYDIVDATGATVATGFTGYNVASSTKLAAGSYYLRLYGPSSGTTNASSYTLTYWTGAPVVGSSASDAAGNSAATALNLGTLSTTAISKADYVGPSDGDDFYKFTLAKASRVSFLLGGAPSGVSVYSTLYDSTGTTALYSGTVAGLSAIDLSAGTYYLQINDGYEEVPYRLTASATSISSVGGSMSSPKALGKLGTTPVSATSEAFFVPNGSPGSSDYYSFSVDPNVTTVFKVSGSTMSSSDPSPRWVLDIFDKDGNSYTSVTGSGDGSYSLSLPSGSYTAVLSAYPYYSGSPTAFRYTLSASTGPAAPDGPGGKTLATAAALPALTATQATVANDWVRSASGSDYYSFKLTAGATVSFRLDTQGGSNLLLLDANGNLILSDGASDRAHPGMVTASLAAGTYYLRVDPQSDAVRYAIIGQQTPLPDGPAGNGIASAKTLSPSTTRQTVADWVGRAAADDYYKVTLGAAGRLNLNLVADDLPVLVEILDAQGNSLGANTTTGLAVNDTLSQDLAAGTYYVHVSSAGYQTTTSYSLTYWTGAAALGTATAADGAGNSFAAAKVIGTLGAATTTVADWVGPQDGVDFYKFTLTSASIASFGLTAGAPGTGSAIDLHLYDADGNSIGSIINDTWYGVEKSGRLLLQAGTYYAAVIPGSGAASGYSMAVSATAVTNGAGSTLPTAKDLGINPGTTTYSDIVSSYGTEYVHFALTTPTWVDLTLTSKSSAVYLSLRDANNQPIGNADQYATPSGPAAFSEMLAAGDYYVAITGTDSGPHGYALSVAPVGATLSAPVLVEGNSGTSSLVFTVTLSHAVSLPVTLTYATSNGSALAGSDYTAATGTLTIAAGATTGTISVPVTGDTLYEADETVTLTLANASGVTFAGGAKTLAATGTIKNDDAPPVASVADVSVLEGNSGTTSLVFTVTLSAASGLPTTIAYAVANGSAAAGSDYTAASGTLTIAAGATSGTITIPVTGDTLYEADETVKLTLSSPSGATFAGGATTLTATGTIKNDDLPPIASIAPASVVEGDSGTTNLVFTVTLSAASALPATIAYETFNGSATGGSDFTPLTGTLTIAAGATTATISVPVLGDGTYEANETLGLRLYNPSGVNFAGGVASISTAGTITNDDPLPVATLAAASIVEGNSGTAALVFTVTLSAASSQATTFSYATANGSALAGSDFTATSGTLTIAAGQTTGTITVPVTGDTLYEADETLSLTLSSPAGATFPGGASSVTASGTIRNDDAPPVATIADVSVVEGNSGTTSLVFTVTLSAASALPTTIAYATSNGTATAGSDYTAASGTLTIAAGATTGTITIAVTGDTAYEADETLKLTLSSPSGASFAGGASTLVATGTIKNDDTAQTASIANVSVVEGNSGTTNLVFTVTLSSAATTATTIAYATSNGTATAGSDYTAASGTLTIAAGATTGTITVAVTGDTLVEPDETLKLTLSNPVGAGFAGGATSLVATGTIQNDDAAPIATVADVSVLESNSGTTSLVFTVTLSKASAGAVTLAYATANGTATAGTDYTAASGTLTIAAGATTGTITIPVTGDALYEGDETVKLTLSSPSGASFAGGATTLVATGTIRNDDLPPIASISPASIVEGNSGTSNLVFTVTLSAASALPATIAYETFNGSATAGSDYAAVSGTLTIAAGATTGTISVPITGDTLYEANETLGIRLYNPSGVNFAGGVASISTAGTITNDDVSPVISLTGSSVVEGNSGTANLVFTVTLSAASALPTTVAYQTSNVNSTAGVDYVATSGTLTIAAGATTGTITVPVIGDTTYEGDRLVRLTLTSPSGATLPGNGVELSADGTIKDDDGMPVASISPTGTVKETNTTTDVGFWVTLSNPSATPVSFTYQTFDGTAVAGYDYIAASGTITVQPGQTSAGIIIKMLGDTTYEGDETFGVKFTNPVGATITGGATSLSSTATIQNDDAPPVASIADVAVVEGNAGTTSLVFTVTLSAASGLPTTIAYATSNGTATAGSDYTAATGTLTIAAGQTTGKITVAVTGDTTYEADETLKLTFSSPSGATFAGGASTLVATGTIKNDDSAAVASISDVAVAEGNSGTTNLVFTVTLSAASTSATTIAYATANGTATAGSDYTAASGTLTIAAGATTGTVAVAVTGDTTYEADETVKLTLSNPSGASFAGGATSVTATGTIKNDDAADIIRVSTTSTGDQANGASGGGVLSPDGKKVAFWSTASNLVSGDTNGGADVFVKDLTTGAVTRVSTTSAGGQADGATTIRSIVFSPDGTKIGFISNAANLTPGDTNGVADVFVKDLVTGVITRIPSWNGTQPDGDSFGLTFSPDGTLVGFASSAGNMVANDGNGLPDAFVVDLAKLGVTRVSTGAGGAEGNGWSGNPVFSSDGKKVAFYSRASNFVAGDTTAGTNGYDIFVKDLTTGAITRVSTTATGAEANDDSYEPVFSPDGGKIAFHSYASNLVAGDTNGTVDIFVKDLATGAITRVSTTASGAQATGSSMTAVFSPDGTKIAFQSDAPNLVAGDTNATWDVFVKDLVTGAVTRWSTSGMGGEGNGASTNFRFSADGTRIVFQSDASNLVAGDTNGGADVFVKKITSGSAFSIAAVSPSSKVEGSSGSTAYTFTVTRSGATTSAQTVAWAVTGSGTIPANGADFVGGALPGGTLSFAAGETSKTVTVNVAGDTVLEGDESFAVTLSAPSAGASLGTSVAFATIRNDDAAPVASIADVAVAEGNAGTTNLVFTVQLSAASAMATTIAYATADGTATAGTDYTAASGTLTIAAGATTGTITIAVTGDTAVEANETLKLTLSSPSGASFAGGATSLTATGTISNDDFTPVGLKLLPANFQIVDGLSTGTPAPAPAPIALSSLVTTLTAANDVIQSYQIVDTNAAAGSAFVSVNGVKQAASTPITLTPAQFAQAVINPGASGGLDGIMVSATGKGGTGESGMILTTTTVTGVPQLGGRDTTVAASSTTPLSAIVNPLTTVPITAYQLLDMNGDPNSGSFKVGGATQAAYTVIDVMASQLAGTSFVAGAAGTSDQVWVRAFNGSNWSGWGSLKVSAAIAVV